MFGFKHIVIIPVLAIVLLHTIVVHKHWHSSDGACQINLPRTSISLIDGLDFALAVDHGAGHLEHYLSLDNNFLFPPLVAWQFAPVLSSKSLSWPHLNEQPVKAPDQRKLYLRGPPLLG